MIAGFIVRSLLTSAHRIFLTASEAKFKSNHFVNGVDYIIREISSDIKMFEPLSSKMMNFINYFNMSNISSIILSSNYKFRRNFMRAILFGITQFELATKKFTIPKISIAGASKLIYPVTKFIESLGIYVRKNNDGSLTNVDEKGMIKLCKFMNSTLFIYQPKSWIFNDEIKSIKFVSTNAKYVYDLSLDEKYCGNKHIFIANDFLAHNSLDSAHGAAKRDFDYFKGLLSFTKKQATTPMIIRLYKKHERNIVTVGNTAKRLIYVDIKPFVKKIELIYDPDITKTRIPEDKTIILLYLEMMTISINTLSKY